MNIAGVLANINFTNKASSDSLCMSHCGVCCIMTVAFMTLIIVLPGTKGIIYAYAQNSIFMVYAHTSDDGKLSKIGIFLLVFFHDVYGTKGRVLHFAVLLISYIKNAVDH